MENPKNFNMHLEKGKSIKVFCKNYIKLTKNILQFFAFF